MVANAASFGRSGIHDYLLIRASSIVLATYVIFILGFIGFNSSLSYETWHGLFSTLAMKVYTLLTLIALLIHSWIGIWQILTDYVKNITLRGLLLFVFVIAAFCYLAAGIFILWGV